MLGPSPLRAAVTLPFTRCRYCRTPAIAIAQAACDVHDDNDNDDNNNDNDNAWQRGPLWLYGMGPIRDETAIMKLLLNSMCLALCHVWRRNVDGWRRTKVTACVQYAKHSAEYQSANRIKVTARVIGGLQCRCVYSFTLMPVAICRLSHYMS